MEARSIPEMSVYFNKTTRRNIPEGCHFYTSRHENLKSYLGYTCPFAFCVRLPCISKLPFYDGCPDGIVSYFRGLISILTGIGLNVWGSIPGGACMCSDLLHCEPGTVSSGANGKGLHP
jgi:hypothetical protein